jgi:hypothetical protein
VGLFKRDNGTRQPVATEDDDEGPNHQAEVTELLDIAPRRS